MARVKRGLTRERMIEAIRDLPPDASVDDAIERLVFLAKIEAATRIPRPWPSRAGTRRS